MPVNQPTSVMVTRMHTYADLCSMKGVFAGLVGMRNIDLGLNIGLRQLLGDKGIGKMRADRVAAERLGRLDFQEAFKGKISDPNNAEKCIHEIARAIGGHAVIFYHKWNGGIQTLWFIADDANKNAIKGFTADKPLVSVSYQWGADRRFSRNDDLRYEEYRRADIHRSLIRRYEKVDGTALAFTMDIMEQLEIPLPEEMVELQGDGQL